VVRRKEDDLLDVLDILAARIDIEVEDEDADGGGDE